MTAAGETLKPVGIGSIQSGECSLVGLVLLS